MSIKGISVRYNELLTIPSTFKGTVDMNQNSLEKCKMQGMLCVSLTQSLS